MFINIMRLMLNVLLPPGFKKGFCCVFLHYEFHAGFRHRSSRLILHKILNVYPHTKFMNKGV